MRSVKRVPKEAKGKINEKGGGNSSCWKTNCSFTITIVNTAKQQQTRLPSWMRQSPITKSSYCVSDILHMMHVVMNNVAPPMGQTAYYWKWSSKHYRWDVWIPLDMISIEPIITETLVVADQTSAVSVCRLVYWRSAAPVWEEQSPASLKCDCRAEYQKITRIWQRAFRRDLTWMLPSFYCFHDDRGRSQLWGHWCPDLLAVLLLLIDSFIWLESFIWIFQRVHLARTKV